MLRVPARNAPGVIRLPIVTAAVLAALSCADEGTRPDPGSPTRLTFLLQPSDASAGAALGPVEVAFEDDDGNLVSSASATVTLALTPVGATLNGTTSVLASSGTATFTDLAVENAGNGYTLTATAPGVTGATSTAFDVAPGPAAALEVVVQPTTATAGAAISPGIQLAVRDEFGNIAATGSTSVTLALTPGTGAPGATLGGTTTGSAVNGLATFGDLTIDKPGMAYSLSATATGLPGATTDAFDITAGQAARLVFMDQPSDAVAGAMMAPLIRVALQDAAGNAVAGSAASVTIGVTGGTGASGATLNGTRTRAAVDGIATFDDLSLDKASDGYTLTASSGSLTSAIRVHPDGFVGIAHVRHQRTVQDRCRCAGAACVYRTAQRSGCWRHDLSRATGRRARRVWKRGKLRDDGCHPRDHERNGNARGTADGNDHAIRGGRCRDVRWRHDHRCGQRLYADRLGIWADIDHQQQLQRECRRRRLRESAARMAFL